ncbi:uncharacterized protein BJ171DRAFT_515660 [Polychytrium aggregatum]|uniref:uncharacterized protein n=1 Tax=Polychytrium aggregatum TaxID=110093 RepID=UPI0022FF31A9|nr:uncharacterized protein BJ171DRAFT_515660 [Polychytrium aggregatum]KAI9202091.1 hypothetical protein BJ171DRAFT_515660 [Polychytrium aggregatum]
MNERLPPATETVQPNKRQRLDKPAETAKIERIIAHRLHDNKLYFRVKHTGSTDVFWVGHDEVVPKLLVLLYKRTCSPADALDLSDEYLTQRPARESPLPSVGITRATEGSARTAAPAPSLDRDAPSPSGVAPSRSEGARESAPATRPVPVSAATQPVSGKSTSTLQPESGPKRAPMARKSLGGPKLPISTANQSPASTSASGLGPPAGAAQAQAQDVPSASSPTNAQAINPDLTPRVEQRRQEPVPYPSSGLHDVKIENTIDGDLGPSGFAWVEANIFCDAQIITSFSKAQSVVSCQCSLIIKTQVCRPRTCECYKGKDYEFPYDNNRRLALGAGRPIRECGKKCACNLECPSRVVQRGPDNRRIGQLVLFKTRNKGWAVRCTQDIKQGTFIGEYVGDVRRTGHDAPTSSRYIFGLDYNTHGDPKYEIDSERNGNITRFFNHSCEANLVQRAVFIDEPYDSEFHRLAIFALRNINKGEELTLDYNGDKRLQTPEVEISNDDFPFDCDCGSRKCRRPTAVQPLPTGRFMARKKLSGKPRKKS